VALHHSALQNRCSQILLFGGLEVQLFEDELAEDELLAVAMFFQFTDY